ncbi:MAG: hypothetical protein R6T89_06050, partial [Candidatus Syntrophosphaera sp.]
ADSDRSAFHWQAGIPRTALSSLTVLRVFSKIRLKILQICDPYLCQAILPSCQSVNQAFIKP